MKKLILAVTVAALLAPIPALAQMNHSSGHAMTGGMTMGQPKGALGNGTVNKVDPAGRKVNVTHGPIVELKWPGMTMDFSVAQEIDLAALKPGAKIDFTVAKAGDGSFQITSITMR